MYYVYLAYNFQSNHNYTIRQIFVYIALISCNFNISCNGNTLPKVVTKW